MISLKDKDEKIVGYIIIIIGLCIMGYSIFSVLSISLGGNVPIEILHAPDEEEQSDLQPVGISNDSENISIPSIDFGQMITPLYPMFNLMSWLLIAFVILAGGGRVAIIGIKIMKASIPDVRVVRNEMIKKIGGNSESISIKKEEK
jgi:hypothetical protein